MLWILHELGDGSQACELVLSFSVYRGFGNTPTFSINDRPMDGTVEDGALLMGHIQELLRKNINVFRHLDELPGFTFKPKTTR